jgi:hypothetical protein
MARRGRGKRSDVVRRRLRGDGRLSAGARAELPHVRQAEAFVVGFRGHASPSPASRAYAIGCGCGPLGRHRPAEVECGLDRRQFLAVSSPSLVSRARMMTSSTFLPWCGYCTVGLLSSKFLKSIVNTGPRHQRMSASLKSATNTARKVADPLTWGRISDCQS